MKGPLNLAALCLSDHSNHSIFHFTITNLPTFTFINPILFLSQSHLMLLKLPYHLSHKILRHAC